MEYFKANRAVLEHALFEDESNPSIILPMPNKIASNATGEYLVATAGNYDIIKKRAQGLYNIDESKKLRKSHENPSIITIYKEFLGEPCGHKSHELLHTHYFDKQKVIEVKVD